MTRRITFPSSDGTPLTADYEPHEFEFMRQLRGQLDGPDSEWAQKSMTMIHELKATFPGSVLLENDLPIPSEVQMSPSIWNQASDDSDDLPGTQVNPVARAGDPDTSHMAADSIPSEKIRERQKAVLVCLNQFGPMTDEQIAVVYPQVPGLPEQSPSGLRTRRSELHRTGYVVDTGEKRILESGRLAIVWGLPSQQEQMHF